MKPTTTIYQNERHVMIIFSKVDRTYHGSTTSFENSWSDGGACGISGFKSRKELNQYLKENNYKKKGTIKLDIYCWSTHNVKTVGKRIHGGTATCMLKKNHKGKHKGSVSGLDLVGDDIEVEWK